MGSKDSNKPESTLTGNEDSLSPDRPLRLSVKGAVRETGNLPKFEVSFDPNSHTAQFEKDTILREQLESVDFYIEQGFIEVAFTTLERLEMIFPNHPLISEKLDRMANMELSGVIKTEVITKPKPEPVVEPPPPEPEPIAFNQEIPKLPEFKVLNTGQLLEIKEASEEDEDALNSIPEITVEQMEPITGETGLLPAIEVALFMEATFAPPPAIAPPSEPIPSFEPVLPTVDNNSAETSSIAPAENNEPVVSEDAKVDESQEDVVIDDAPTLDDAPALVDEPAVDDTLMVVDASNSVEEAPANDFTAVQTGLQSFFEDFDNEVDEDMEADFQSHFNVGLSYFEIELWDDAIEEFQAAYRAVSAGTAHLRTFTCCLMLGRCFHAKGMLRPALIWLRRAMDMPGHSEEEYLEGRYEMALVHEKLGERKRARELFEQIASANANYQDVQSRLEELKKKS